MSKTLAKEFAQLSIDFDGASFNIITANQWRQLSGQPYFISSTYFDLAGLTMDDKTLFFEGATIQEVLPPVNTPATAGNIIQVADIMCSTPLTDTEAASFLLGGNFSGPASSTLTFDQTIYGRVRTFNADLDNLASGYMIALGDNQLGSLESTASDRIYCYRVVFFSGVPCRFDVYPARYILRANAKEEPEFEYLMRLKRSYELQNEPDRD